MALVHQLGWDPRFVARSPWFWPLAAAAAQLEAHADWPTTDELGLLHASFTRSSGVPALRFGENVRTQDKRVRGRVNLGALYDARITLQHEVPSRSRDWHDLLNALCFITFPRAKQALHARQYDILTRRIGPDATGLPGARTREQDALTLFDEGGVIIAVDPAAGRHVAALDEAGRRAAAQEIVGAGGRPVVEAWGGRASVVVFGHALYEHLVEGLACPGSFTRWIPVSGLPADTADLLARVDEGLARDLRDPTCFLDPGRCGSVPLALG